MIVAHLTSSGAFGGPERQVIGMCRQLPTSVRSVFLMFPDRGRSEAFRSRLESAGLGTFVLAHDTPHLRAMVGDVVGLLQDLGADVLCTQGYKADVVGLLAARRVGVPVVAVSRGWTGETWKVKAYEALDRLALRRVDRVVCVSEGQAAKVRRSGVLGDRIAVVRNGIDVSRFDSPEPDGRKRVEAFFRTPPRFLVGSVGRLSPEKGYGVLVEAAAEIVQQVPDVGFLHLGDGPLRNELAGRIEELGLSDRFVLAGFRNDVDQLTPHWDVSVLPSYTEGLPNVVLESLAAGVPVVATAVGGTPEALRDGVDGFLVPPGDPHALATRIIDLSRSESDRLAMGRNGRERIQAEFTHEAQAQAFHRVLESLVSQNSLVSSRHR